MQGTSPCCEEGSQLKATTMSNYLKSCTMTHGDREDMKTSCPLCVCCKSYLEFRKILLDSAESCEDRVVGFRDIEL